MFIGAWYDWNLLFSGLAEGMHCTEGQTGAWYDWKQTLGPLSALELRRQMAGAAWGSELSAQHRSAMSASKFTANSFHALGCPSVIGALEALCH